MVQYWSKNGIKTPISWYIWLTSSQKAWVRPWAAPAALAARAKFTLVQRWYNGAILVQYWYQNSYIVVHMTYFLSAGVSSPLSSACSSRSSWLSLPVLCTLCGRTGLAILRTLPTRTNSSKPSSSNLWPRGGAELLHGQLGGYWFSSV